jgi:PadR family transcriptional regulator AphA
VTEPSRRAGASPRTPPTRRGSAGQRSRARSAARNGATPPPGELSDLEVALLGLLSVRPMTGYEIRRHFDRALAPWWDTPRTQIYPKLRELEARQLIAHEYVIQESKPNKRVYSPTDRGRQLLQQWLHQPITWPAMRHHMMIRLFLGHLMPAADLRGLLASYRDEVMDWSAELRQIEAKFSKSLAGPYRDAVFFELLALQQLISMARFEATAASRALKALEQASESTQPGNGELAGRLLDIIHEHPG